MQSNYMSRQSVSSLSQSNTVPSLLPKSGDLNSLHLDQAALSLVFHHEENENVASSQKNSTVKHRMKKNEKKNYYHKAGHKSNSGQHKHNLLQSARRVAEQQVSANSDESSSVCSKARSQSHNNFGDGPNPTSQTSHKNLMQDKVGTALLSLLLWR